MDCDFDRRVKEKKFLFYKRVKFVIYNVQYFKENYFKNLFANSNSQQMGFLRKKEDMQTCGNKLFDYLKKC